MRPTSEEELIPVLEMLRRRLDKAFSPETAATGFPPTTPSAGHCAAVSAILRGIVGGEMVSTRIDGMSHWFNRVPLGGSEFDFDLTGDQFGRSTIQIALAGYLYPATRVRSPSELNAETLQRATLLASRANLDAPDYSSDV